MKYLPLLFFFTSLPLLAQYDAASVPLPIWEAPIPESQGKFTVSLNSICSIAVEFYDLQYEKETYPVTEFSIETVGGKTARFYFIDEDKAKKSEERQEEKSPVKPFKDAVSFFLPESEDDQTDNEFRVVKVYPQSSTSSSVEYRLKTQSEVFELYRNLREAWLKWAP